MELLIKKIYVHIGNNVYLFIYLSIYLYVSIHSIISVITCARFCLKQMWRLTKAMTEMKRENCYSYFYNYLRSNLQR